MSGLGKRLNALEKSNAPMGRFLVVSGPDGFDATAALLSKGIVRKPQDLVITINKPGDVEVEIVPTNLSHEDALAELAKDEDR